MCALGSPADVKSEIISIFYIKSLGLLFYTILDLKKKITRYTYVLCNKATTWIRNQSSGPKQIYVCPLPKQKRYPNYFILDLFKYNNTQRLNTFSQILQIKRYENVIEQLIYRKKN